MSENECTKCIHKEVCKTAESCDGFVSGCKHFKEQKKGRWEHLLQVFDGAGFVDVYGCSECVHKESVPLDGITPNYCPNCGAKMDGGNEDV